MTGCFKFIIPMTDLTTRILYFTGNICIALFSITGNGLVMYVVWFKPCLRTPTFCLMSALALSDFLTAIFGQLTYNVEVAFKQSTTCTYDKVIAFFNSSSCSFGIFLLCLIARDRYLHITKGIRYHDFASIKSALIGILCCYFSSMAVAMLFTFENRILRIASTFAFAIIAGSCFTYIVIHSKLIYNAIRTHANTMNIALQKMEEGNSHSSNKFRKDVEKGVNRSLFSVIILFFCAWTPVVTLMMIFTIHNIIEQPISDHYRYAFAWGSSVSYINGALNPLIYAYRCDAIGYEIRRILSQIVSRGNRTGVLMGDTEGKSKKRMAAAVATAIN